jgi:hypothetical protein
MSPDDTACPHLEYRHATPDHDFDGERAYCALGETFVSPMRADICNNRHGFAHETHCEWYRAETERE